ncbi:hypothetical protein AJ79_07488 [Helicocarpus griseus UAMH5409]|uniref:Nucleolar pre-ribosomal-associated protein 1 N-terminal domain-containing protein n=1 Tax=Helicocarpus griseus UAMH5409 TaxID=1447875 RepID=A0A2B7X2D8_9EURO|nr:hypothetical protein AJ79_07488 [Helicocarpus griseus UAMH5409]
MAHFHEDSSRAKRRRIDNDSSSVPPPAITINSHTQLRSILAFQQSASHEVRQGVRYFKDFLTSINEAEKENEKAKKFRILKAYCDSQLVNADDESQASCFHDILQTWNFAESESQESLLSLIPSVLALFLKTISSQLQFRDFGLVLCKFLLQKEQLRLFNRGMTASKTKEHLISPCIRLLTEIVSFDGGAVARLVYGRREITLKRLDLFLTVPKSLVETDPEDSQKSTLRRNAQRYLLANLKFQNATAKEDIIGQAKLIRAFLEDIRRDSRDIIIDIIKAIDKHIASDGALSRNAKSRFLNRWNLERLATLYGFERDSDEPAANGVSVSKEVHKFLLAICTDPDKGVLLPETGWYPTGSTPDVLPPTDDGAIPLGLDSPVHFDKYKESVPVRNGNLSALIQCLRPESDTLQSELSLKAFRAAPELVFEYFSKRTMFISDPKPDPRWLGESAFLFSTVQLPVPANCGWKGSQALVPPPVSVVIESILPRPLTQKILTRCLNLNAEVVTLFAVRIVTLALRKLQKILRNFNADRETGQELWVQAAGKLVDEFCRRCPSMKDVILLFRNTAKDNILQQEAVLELLSMFYQVIPTVALEEKFDISLTLVDVLKKLNEGQLEAENKELLFNQLQHLLVIAQQSPTMRWWQRPDSLEYSAFVSVFKVLTEASEDSPAEDIKTLVQDTLLQNSVVLSPASFDALLSSIDTSDSTALAVQLSFLDNCITRLVKKPVHYSDIAQSLVREGAENLSLLVGAINEQWPFVVKSGQSDKQATISAWIARFLGLLSAAGEDEKGLKTVRDVVIESTENKKERSALKKAFKHAKEADDKNEDDHKAGSADVVSKLEAQSKVSRADLAEMFGTVPVEGESHPALNRWDKEEIELSLEQGNVGELLRCLCSNYGEVRKQASGAIARFMAKILNSTYEERQPIYIAAGEVLETAKEVGLETPLPYIAGELAARIVIVLMDPLHKLYGKVNKFLNKGPRWEVAKIPSYWIDKILLQESEYDDSHHEEVGWLLGLFINGLRTKKDMDLYRRANVFERVLSLYNSPGLTESLRRMILHLMYRACEVDGSTTLLTRAGALSWVQGQVSVQDRQGDILKAIAREMYDKCGHEWIDKWSGSSLPQVAAGISS